MTTRTPTAKILILGGGYAGVMAAIRLAHKTKQFGTTITLISKLEHFVERPRLHEAATGIKLKERSIARMLRGTKARFQKATVKAINPTAKHVVVETDYGEEQLSYDYLINALGSSTARAAVPGVTKYAYTLDPFGDLTTDKLRTKLSHYRGQSVEVVVVGGGATGVEAATQIKGMVPHANVSIVTQGKLGAFKGERVQRHIAAAFIEQGIRVYEDSQVTRIEQDAVILPTQRIPADVSIWTGGFQASPIAQEAGLRSNDRNQVLVDPYLRSLSHPAIFAAGDAMMTVEEPGAPLRMSVFTALVSGAQAGENVAAVVLGESPKPLSYLWYGQGIALGPHDAVGFSTYPRDKAWPLVLRRGLAVRMRNFFVWYLTAALELERRFPGSFFWNGKGRYHQQKQRLKRLKRPQSPEATV